MPPRSIRASIIVPTSAPLPSTLRLPSTHPSTSRPLSRLSRLSRPSLLSLIQEWLQTHNQSTCGPFLGTDDDDDDAGGERPIYNPARTLDELREVYEELRARKGSKREVLDRVLEGDWRHGISLRQLAMVDVQLLLDHPGSANWMALKLVRVTGAEDGDEAKVEVKGKVEELPRFHAPTFLANLQREIGALVKTHYHLAHLESLPVTLLRVYAHESPYNSQASISLQPGLNSGRTLFVAFPDGSPFVYVSTAAGGSGVDIKGILIDAIPKAFSKPKARWAFKSTALSAKSLATLCEKRGGGNTNAAGGGWSVFAEGSVESSPLRACTGENESEDGIEPAEDSRTANGRSNPRKRLSDDVVDTSSKMPIQKRRKLVASRRFGSTALLSDGKGLERLQIRLEDAFPGASADAPSAFTATEPANAPNGTRSTRRGRRSTLALQAVDDDAAQSDDIVQTVDDENSWRPQVEIVLHGSHVFAGIRQCVEDGVVDGDKMPGWMTGEDSVSTGVVRKGRIRGFKGGGV